MTTGHVIFIAAGVWVVMTIAGIYIVAGLSGYARRSARRERDGQHRKSFLGSSKSKLAVVKMPI